MLLTGDFDVEGSEAQIPGGAKEKKKFLSR